MFYGLFQINWLAVLAGLVVFFLLGGIWFQLVVGKAYEAALGVVQKEGALSLIGPLVCLAIITTANNWLMMALNIHNVFSALGLGLFIGIGFLVPMVLNIAINPLFTRPFYYTIINAPFFIGGCVLSCIVMVFI
ncbi:DUF1761 family protein [Enterobacteriaceae bacterium RIT697]|uniref:DUF1761 domain-containing protein n=1 Tax=Pantoea endophytica TaxID=92488 RepID=UPI0012AD78EA|nr:DUF1761 domain-containing protein [Pantoea endophytica]MRT24994.1 DUF1761 family protein [Enterobacteriaceae bacterium RIT697]